MIDVKNLSKDYILKKKDSGLKGALKEHDLFRNPLKLGYTGMTEKE